MPGIELKLFISLLNPLTNCRGRHSYPHFRLLGVVKLAPAHTGSGRCDMKAFKQTCGQSVSRAHVLSHCSMLSPPVCWAKTGSLGLLIGY